MPSSLRVGDVRRSGKQWGRRPTSRRDSCPGCGRFVKTGSSSCTCGATFERISATLAEVTGLAR